MESQFEQHENIIKPENMNDIKLLEVSEGEEGSDDAINVFANSEDDQDIVEAKVREILVAKNWWLKESWQNKNIKEQVLFKIGNLEISLYNCNEPLNSEQIRSLDSILRIFATLKRGEVFDKIHSILIDNVQKKNQNTGEDLNGWGCFDKGMVLYPNALKPVKHRVPKVSNFDGTVIHELSHSIGKDFEQEWEDEFGWKQRDQREKLVGDAYSYQYNETPDKCVTDYAKISSAEDICESMVAALKNPEVLDPARLKFIESEILDKDAAIPTSKVEVRNEDKITFPKLKQPVKYIRKQPTIKWKSVN